MLQDVTKTMELEYLFESSSKGSFSKEGVIKGYIACKMLQGWSL